MRLRPRSLKRQLLIRFVAAQIVLMIAGLAVFPLVSPYVNYRMIADRTVRELLLASLRRRPDGQLLLQPSPKLQRYAARRPGLAYAVVDRANLRIAVGSAPELAAVVRQIGAFLPRDEDSLMTERPGYPGDTIIATGQPSALGDLVIAIAGDRFGREDLIDFADDFTPALMPVIAPLLLCTLLVPLALGRALRPLSKAAEQAQKIEMRALGHRLTEEGIPGELLPLVAAINAALARLQAGTDRQRMFMANAAHELRTPVAILQARVDGLPASLESRRGLQRDLHRVRLAVEQLLTFAQLDELEALADEPVELVATIRAVVADHAPLAIRVGREIEYAPLVAHAWVLGDTRGIEGAMANLIDNALRAEPAGGRICVCIRVGIAIEVIDHGPGVSADDAERIFEPFWRKDERQPGAGLGLAIVRQVAQLHRGSISVHETRGGGATFRLELPEIEPQPAPTGSERQVQAMLG